MTTSRRQFLTGSAAAAMGLATGRAAISCSGGPSSERDRSHAERGNEKSPAKKALIAITLDLEMSRHYPKRGMTEWDYQKGNLDEPTKNYTTEACRIVKERGGVLHTFCVGRVLEQPNVDWLKQIARDGHPVGNHTYDHVNVKGKTAEATQYRFQRAPWLVHGKTAREVIRENIAMTTRGLQHRIGIAPDGFRTPGGFRNGLADVPHIQRMLLDMGYTWASAKYPAHKSGKPKEEPTPDVYASIVEAQKNAQPFVYPSGLIEIPMSPISDVTAFRSKFWKLDYFLKAIRLAVEWAIENRAVFDFLGHPSCLVVEDPKFETIQMICDLVEDAGEKAEIVGLSTMAERVKKRRAES